MGQKFLITIYVVIVFSILNSCRPSLLITDEYEKIDIEDVYNHFNNLHQNIKTYSVRRISISVADGPYSQTVRGSVRIKRDSIILMSFNMFAGIEAARIKLTPDSVLMVDRINREYFKGEFVESHSILPFNLNFFELQTIFIGKPATIGVRIDDSFKELVYEDNSNAILKFTELSHFKRKRTDDRQLKNTEIYINNKMLIKKILIDDIGSGFKYKIDYDRYSELDGVILPSVIDILQKRDENVLRITLQMSGIEINRDIAFPFNIPGGYNEL